MEHVDVNQAHMELLDELFGSEKPKNLHDSEIYRSDYEKAMNKVQDKHGLRQGHPQFLEWVFTCVGRSPIIIEDKPKGAGEHGE